MGGKQLSAEEFCLSAYTQLETIDLQTVVEKQPAECLMYTRYENSSIFVRNL